MFRFAIQRKVFVGMLFLCFTMLGIVSYRHLMVELYPNAELPVLFVQIGSTMEIDPEYMENQAIIPIEGAIGKLEGIEEINSTAGGQRGIIMVYYTRSTNIKYAYLKLQEKVNEIRNSIPDDFVVMVVKVDTEQLTNRFMSLQVRGGGGIDRVRNFTDKEILTELENINGVANAEVFGGREKSLEIELDNEACKAYGITTSYVRNVLAQNGQARMYAGHIAGINKRIFVNVSAEYNSVVALLLIPMLTHTFLKTGNKRKALMFEKVSVHNRLIQVYLTVLKSCLRYPARTIVGALVVFFATILIALAVSINSLNEVENKEFSVYVTMPSGSTLENTDAVVKEAEQKFGNIRDIQDITSKIYADEAVITIKIPDDFEDDGNRGIAEIKHEVQQQTKSIQNAEVSLEAPQKSSSRFSGGRFGGNNPAAGFERLLGIGTNTEKIVIKGSDFEQMKNIAEDIEYYLSTLGNIEYASYNVAVRVYISWMI